MSTITSSAGLGASIAAKLKNRPVDAHDVVYYREMLTLIEEYELASMEENIVGDANLYIVFMGLYIIVDDINGAKHLWRRSPAHVKSNFAYTQLKNVCSLLMKNDMKAVNQILVSTPWSECTFMNYSIIETVFFFLRARLWKTVHKTHKIIELNILAQYVMLNFDETKAECNKLGWHIDDSNMVTPIATNSIDSIDIADDQLVLIKSLSNYISHLERKQVKIDIIKGDHNPKI